jgi:phage-related protein
VTVASGVELASAYVQLLPSMRGFARDAQRQMGPIAGRIGAQFGDDFGRQFQRASDGTIRDMQGRFVRESDIAGGASGGAYGDAFGDAAQVDAGSTGMSLGKKVGAAAALAIGAAVAASIKEGADQEVDKDRLAAAIGATPKEQKRLGKLAGKIYAQAYGESFGDVTGALENVRSSFRELGTGSELEKVTKQALDFSSIFQLDLPRAVQVAQTAVRSGFAKDGTQAFNLFTKSLQKVAPNLREDVLDAVNEYGQFFKSVGIDGPRAMELLIKASGKSQFGIDKLGDAVKEFTIRSTDMSTASTDAFRLIGVAPEKAANDILKGGEAARKATNDVVDGLLSLGPGAKQANAAIALFGTPLEDLNVKDIPSFLEGLKSTEKGLKGYRGAIEDAGAVLNDNASTNLEQFKRTVTQTFVHVIGGRVVPALRDFSRKLNEDLGPVIRDIGPYVKQFGEFFVRDVVPAISTFVDYVRQNVLPIVLELQGNTLRTLYDLRGQFGSAFNDIKTIFTSAVTIVRAIWAKFGDFIKAYIRGTLGNVVRVIGGAFKVVAGLFQIVASVIKGDWGGAWEGVKKVVKGTLAIVRGLVSQLWNTIKFAFKSGGAALKGIVVGAFNAVVNVAKFNIARLVDLVANLPERIKNLGSDMLRAGKDLIGKLFDGILEAARNAGGFVGSLVESIKNAINSALNLPLAIKFKKGPININATLIPAFADGTRFAPGGLALVGEEGPELVTLPRGSRVDTAARTKAMASGLSSGAGQGSGRWALEITNWQTGTGFIRWIADEAVSSASDLAGERMRAGAGATAW